MLFGVLLDLLAGALHVLAGAFHRLAAGERQRPDKQGNAGNDRVDPIWKNCFYHSTTLTARQQRRHRALSEQ